MLLFSQRKSEERGYNYRSNTSSGSNEGSKELTAPCPLPGCTLDISPSFLGLRSALCVFILISFLTFVCQSSISRDKKGKLELNANKLKLHVAWSGLSLGDNSNGKEKGKRKKKHFRSSAFLNRPPAIFTPPEIAQSHEIKPCSVKPAKQKDNLQAGTFTEGPLFSGRIGASASWLSWPTSAQGPQEICGGRGQIASETLPDFFPQIIWKRSQRVESGAVTRWWPCGLRHRTGAWEAQVVDVTGAAANGPHFPPACFFSLSFFLYPLFLNWLPTHSPSLIHFFHFPPHSLLYSLLSSRLLILLGPLMDLS